MAETLIDNGFIYTVINISNHQFAEIVGLDVSDYEDIRNLRIPAMLGTYPVRAIREETFKDNGVIEQLYIQCRQLIIGESAFEGCRNLEVINVEGEPAEYGNPNSRIISIGKKAFKDCSSLKHVKIFSGPQKVRLFEEAFAGCEQLSVFELTICDWSQAVFAGCGNLTKVFVSKDAIIRKDALYCASIINIRADNWKYADPSFLEDLKLRSRIVCLSDSPLVDLVYDGYSVKIQKSPEKNIRANMLS